MGWSSILKPVSKGFKGLSTWASGVKWSSFLKFGAAGGIGFVIYSGWTSAVGSINDATGLSEDNVQTLLFLAVGFIIVCVLVKLLVPDDGNSVNRRPSSSKNVCRSKGGRR